MFEGDEGYTFTFDGQEMTLTLNAQYLTIIADGAQTVYYPKTKLSAAWQGSFESMDGQSIAIEESKLTLGTPSKAVYVFTLSEGVVTFEGGTLALSYGGVLLTYTPDGGDALLLLKEGYAALDIHLPPAVYGEYAAEGEEDHLVLGENGIFWGGTALVCFGYEEKALAYTLGLVVDGEIVFLTPNLTSAFSFKGKDYTIYTPPVKVYVNVTVTFDAEMGSVTVNGETPTSEPFLLVQGEIFTVTIAPTSDTKLFSATLTCGDDTLNLVAGENKQYLNGESTIEVVFTAVFSAEYEGDWVPATTMGSVGKGISIRDSILSDSDGSYPVKKTADGFTYTSSDETIYTLRTQEGTQNRVLSVSGVTENDPASFAYYVKDDGAAAIVVDDKALLGSDWNMQVGEGAAMRALSILSDGSILLDGVKGTVICKDGSAYVVMLSGDLYRLTVEGDELTLTPFRAEDETLTFDRVPPPEPVKLTSKFVGEWKCDEHTVVVDSDGSMTFDGKKYDVYGSDDIYTFTAPYNGEDTQWRLSYNNVVSLNLQIGYDASWKLVKDIPLDAWNWGTSAALNAIKEYSGVFETTATGVPKTLTIYQNGKVSWGEERFLVEYKNKTFAFIGNLGNTFQFAYKDDSSTLTKEGFTVDLDGVEYSFTRKGDAPADYSGE